MYAPQSAIDPSLAALLQTAQMVTPDQTPTVALFAQKMQQGIAQGMPQVQGMPQAKQDYAAAAPSMMENMKRQQMQQMVREAMQPQPAGIEGLPAPNMQGMAEGGVVGYNGEKESEVKSDAEGIKKALALSLGLPLSAIADIASLPINFLRKQYAEASGRDASLTPAADVIRRYTQANAQESAPAPQPAPAEPQPTPPAPPVAPEAQALMQRQGMRGQPSAPSPQPRPPAAQAPAKTGIAQLVEPTQDRSKVDTAGGAFLDEAKKQEAARRKIAAEKEAAIAGMPDLNEQGIAALKRAEEERRRLLGIEQSDDSRRRWAGIFRGWGGDRDAYDRILTGIANRDSLANQAQLASEQAELKLREAQQAKALGQFDRAKALEMEVADLKNKARDDMLKARQIESSLAASEFSAKANIYGTDVSARERAADRAQQALIEGAKLKQQAELNGQTKLANQINAANITVSSAIEKMDRDLEKSFGLNKKLYDMIKQEDMDKNPQIVAGYQNYLNRRNEIYKTAVEPAIRERDRLAAMINAGSGNVQRYDAKGNPIK